MTRVLLAEDDALVREALAAMLQGGGHEVVAVGAAVTSVLLPASSASAYVTSAPQT